MISRGKFPLPFLDEYLAKIKDRHKVEFVDTHVHPLDVMGILHIDDYTLLEDPGAFSDLNVNDLRSRYKEVYEKPGLLEKLNYGRISSVFSQPYCQFFSHNVVREIEGIYKEVTQQRILDEVALKIQLDPELDALKKNALLRAHDDFVSEGGASHKRG